MGSVRRGFSREFFCAVDRQTKLDDNASVSAPIDGFPPTGRFCLHCGATAIQWIALTARNIPKVL
jgi:hypothetical protein